MQFERFPWRGGLPRPSSVAIFLVLGLYLLLVLFPIYWIIVSSFKFPVDTLAMPPLWMFTPTIEAYVNIFAVNNYAKFFFNSAVVAVGTVSIALSVPSRRRDPRRPAHA